MPPLIKHRSDPRIDAALTEFAEFKSGFRRSARGNRWREWEGSRIIIIERSDDRYGWMIVDSEERKRFSPNGYDTEDEAIDSLGSMFIFNP